MTNGPHRTIIAALTLASWFTLAANSTAQSTDADSSPIEIALVSEAQTIVPGTTFTVAIHQKMKPGYHTYWRNPGTIGLPTSIEWDLPAGFKAGEIQWPIPHMTKMAAYHVWGYEGEALLLVDITPPSSLKLGAPVTIRGKATWMCCGKQCYPGFDDLSVVLPVATTSKPDPRWKPAFDRIRAEQPQESDAWKIECVEKAGQYTLRITADSATTLSPGAIRFFDFDRQISSDKPQQMKSRGMKLTLTLQAEEHTPDKLDRLRGILVAKRSWGKDASFRTLAVDVPITRK
ncbi:MAG: DsbC/DsbD-like thiol-disulfide interchange protein [Limisphaerales bacterium]|jgi:DsbC/DsbD-like thiol-disulfide interchange protein